MHESKMRSAPESLCESQSQSLSLSHCHTVTSSAWAAVSFWLQCIIFSTYFTVKFKKIVKTRLKSSKTVEKQSECKLMEGIQEEEQEQEERRRLGQVCDEICRVPLCHLTF